MKKFWENIKLLLAKIWKAFKPWLFRNWFLFFNYFVIVISYLIVRGQDDLYVVKFLLSVWILVSTAYGVYKWLFEKK